jgi:ribonuclease BN (tRNA processing enzyme)
LAKSILHILGCASHKNTRGWPFSGYLLQVGLDLTLFDCGGGVTAEFAGRGFDFTNVARIFVSHTHPDHVSDLPLFLQAIYLTAREKPLDLYLPEDFTAPFESYLKSLYLFKERFPFPLNIIGYRDGLTVTSGELTIRAIGNAHLGNYAERVHAAGVDNRMLAHMFVASVGERKLFYSADLASFEEARPHLADCSVALIEGSHIDITRLFDVAKAQPSTEFLIIHLGSDEEITRLANLIDKSDASNVSLAEPGRVLGV